MNRIVPCLWFDDAAEDAARVVRPLLGMKKLDIADLKRAHGDE